MAVSIELKQLIGSNAPLWAGEAEVIRSYWDSPVRTRDTDRRWLLYQCRKEFWDSFADVEKGLFLEPLDRLRAAFPKIDIEIDRHEVLGIARGFVEEFTHYCAFADVYDAIRADGTEKINPHMLKALDDLPENAELAKLRAAHRKDSGQLGLLACEITEGGYCALFSEGVKLQGRGGADDLIASACRLVLDDEFQHMLKGIVGVDEESLDAGDWKRLRKMTNDQMRVRIRMRNAQFSEPLGPGRIDEIFEGKIEPVEFDFERANLNA
jgi:hypothetical protein